MVNTNNSEIIDRYLSGLMPDEEKEEFENRLVNDPKLRAELLMTRDIYTSISKRGDKLSKIQKWERKTSNENKQSRMKNYLWRASIAAACVMFFVILYISDDSLNKLSSSVNAVSSVDTTSVEMTDTIQSHNSKQ